MEAAHPLPTPEPDIGRAVVAIAASGGGLRALDQVLSGLDAAFPAALMIVQHTGARHVSHLAEILGRHTALSVRTAVEGCRLERGVAWVAPPDHHMLVDHCGVIRLTQTPEVHFVRPAADPLFQSVAASFRSRAIAVILTGAGFDGAAGVRAIKAGGGTVVVQDDATAEYGGMPRAALATGCADHILPLAAIGPTLLDLLETRRDPDRR